MSKFNGKTGAVTCSGFVLPILLWPGILLMLFGGCASKAPRVGGVGPTTVDKRVTETGHAVQLGAFSVLQNAVGLTESLRKKGLSVYVFRHESGLFKVRLGDFPSRAAARTAAERLLNQGTVDTYYLVGPEEYALARSRIHGKDMLREELVKTAEGFLGLPYQWGGSSPKEGFDCSGLTMAVYQLNGINLPRSSREQFLRGRAVTWRALEKGDLVFFNIKGGRKVSHVGVYRGGGDFIHAPGAGKTIRIDSLSKAYFRKRYAGARTYL